MAPRKPKNPDLGLKGEGVERKFITEIDNAAQKYIDERNRRVQQTPKEVEAKKNLATVMKKHKLTEYTFEDDNGDKQNVSMTETVEKVKVKRIVEEEPELD